MLVVLHIYHVCTIAHERTQNKPRGFVVCGGTNFPEHGNTCRPPILTWRGAWKRATELLVFQEMLQAFGRMGDAPESDVV